MLDVFINTAIFEAATLDVFEPVIIVVCEPVDTPADRVVVSNKDVCETLVGREYATTVSGTDDTTSEPRTPSGLIARIEM